MIFKRLIPLIKYDDRLGLIENVHMFNDLLKKYLLYEPHNIYNTSLACKYFKQHFIGTSALSIGADPLKEWCLVDNKCLKDITVLDIDEAYVSSMNKFWLDRSVDIRYINKDIRNVDKIPAQRVQNLLLFQMDYIFSDDEIELIIKKCRSFGISKCFIMTPSLFHFSLPKSIKLNQFVIPVHDILHCVFNLLNSLRLRFYQNKNGSITTYKRTFRHFIKLFNRNGYHEELTEVILNQNGSYHFIVFERK